MALELEWERKREENLMDNIVYSLPAALRDIGPWYQECFSKELTGVT